MQTTRIELTKNLMKSNKRAEQGIHQFVLERADSLEAGTWSKVEGFESERMPADLVEVFTGFVAVSRFLRIHVQTNFGGDVSKLWGFRAFCTALPSQAGGWTQFMSQSLSVGWSRLGDRANGFLGVPNWFGTDLGKLGSNFLFAHSLKGPLEAAARVRMSVIHRESGNTSSIVWQNGQGISAFLGNPTAVLSQAKPWSVERVAVEDAGEATSIIELGTCRSRGFRSIWPTHSGFKFLGKVAKQANTKPNQNCDVGPWDSQILARPESDRPGAPTGTYNFGDGNVGGFIGSAYDFEFWYQAARPSGVWTAPKACKDSGSQAGACKLSLIHISEPTRPY
eukprot:TRINITY_DN52240_c0_g1_i1.p1 TRINITY_DN52240_c0_g1~~TRINITY_DN52240_c0_g1_i1.p1  ORF type:complete len:337 (+),score=56.57 TRINITY_DN52240_c0_g1_i1:245-1255(+)